MNRYRFPKIFASFERKILNIEDATTACSSKVNMYHISPVKTCEESSVANSNFVQIPSKLPKYPEISLKIPKFLLSFSFISFSQSLRNLGLRPPIVCSLPLSFAFESLPKQNFVKYAGQ